MKKIFLILCMLLIASPLYAGGAVFCAAGASYASDLAACSTANDSALHDKVAAGTTVDGSSDFCCIKFVLAADSRITEYIWRGCEDNQTGSLKLSIYTHNGGTNMPDSEVSGSDVTLSNADISNCTTKANHTFTLSSVKSLSAGTYWICADATDGESIQGVYHADVGSRACYGAASCTSSANNSTYDMSVYGCTP